MAGEAGKEIMMLAQSSVESLMRAADGPGSGSGSGADSCEEEEAPDLPPSASFGAAAASATAASAAATPRVEEMRRSIDFIKERFEALKQISRLDPATASEGGWTEDAVEEELKKLKDELAREREKLKAALHAAPRRAAPPSLADTDDDDDATATQRLLALTRRLDRTCRRHDAEVRRRRDGAPPLRRRERFSPLVPHKLHPSPMTRLKPLFRGDRSPEGAFIGRGGERGQASRRGGARRR